MNSQEEISLTRFECAFKDVDSSIVSAKKKQDWALLFAFITVLQGKAILDAPRKSDS